jgi:uncharacterized membrane protein YphA (DoxX/SURF4 family)
VATVVASRPPGPSAPEVLGEMIHFMKNVALMGTMVFIMANGPGPWSLDARSSGVIDTEQAPDD